MVPIHIYLTLHKSALISMYNIFLIMVPIHIYLTLQKSALISMYHIFLQHWGTRWAMTANDGIKPQAIEYSMVSLNVNMVSAMSRNVAKSY